MDRVVGDQDRDSTGRRLEAPAAPSSWCSTGRLICTSARGCHRLRRGSVYARFQLAQSAPIGPTRRLVAHRKVGRPARSTSQGKVCRNIGSGATRDDSPIRHCRRPVEIARRQQDPGHRINLHDVRRGATGVSRTGYTLNCTVRWDTHLHRSARCPLGQTPEQQADRVAQRGSRRRGTGRQRLTHGDHCLGLTVRRGHIGTIRLGPVLLLPAPGSRRSVPARHSCRRCTRHGVTPARSPVRGMDRTGRRWT